jgi:hypothetical protein
VVVVSIVTSAAKTLRGKSPIEAVPIKMNAIALSFFISVDQTL